jgi:hypothetical protein
MAGDFSRSSLNPVEHYTGVLMQQGRVQVDADWNEQLALQLHRTQTETVDLIGKCGTPKSEEGFLISRLPGVQDLRIHPGRYYVNGLLCELDPQWIPIVAVSTATTGALVNLPSLTIDGWDLAVNDWVELADDGGSSLVTQVTAIGASTATTDPNSITPNFYTVTVAKALGGLANAKRLNLRRVTTFITQPFLLDQWDSAMESSPLSGPGGDTLSLPDGDYLVVLDAWLREVNALVDPHIREVALGGPDTCERLQTAWQVHLIPYGGEASPPSSPLASPPDSSPLNCCSDFPGWNEFKNAAKTTGLMNAQAPPPGNNQCPCLLPPSAGYLGIENQLYRVEIFQAGDYNAAATFVWSRDNAMVETTILCIDPQGNVYVNNLGTDDLHSFAQGDWVEIVSPQSELFGQPRFLAQINQTPSQQNAPCGNGNMPAYSISLAATLPTQLLSGTSLRLRRWDMPQSVPQGQTMLTAANGNPLGIQIAQGWMLLENNVQVNFTAGHYAAGDYWQIPARTATGDIEWPPFDVPNVNPIPQPPLGSPHSYCRLAILTIKDGVWHTPVDCRCQFPSLLNICATDVCYKGSDCELQSATTVQQAIDALAARLRFHNKMLHGTGVVCGLAVRCAGDTRVVVAKGYAIDCEGYDLIVDQAVPVNLATLDGASQDGTLTDGDYELVLERAKLDTTAVTAEPRDLEEVTITVNSSPAKETSCCGKPASTEQPNACVSFRVVPCNEPTFAQQMLDGTLLKDFYDHCLKNLIDKFKADYGREYISSDKVVTKTQALVSSLTNLLIQFIQPNLTKDVYISEAEYGYLYDFYKWLRGQLSDKTFCSLLSGAREFPEYTLGNAATMTTIFGKGFKTRLRVDPTGALGYAVGAGPDIYLYDLASGQMAAVVTLPIPGDSSAWVVQDVAFSSDGTQVYAIATGTNTTTSKPDSLFAVGTVSVSPSSVTWTNSVGSLGGLPFLTLAAVANPAGTVAPTLYASVQAQGIFSITFGGTAAPATSPSPVASFTAIGHLISDGEYLLATANSGNAPSGSFDEIIVYRVTSWTTPVTFQITGSLYGDVTDDIALCTYTQQPYVVTILAASAAASSSSDKQLVIFSYQTVDMDGTTQTFQPAGAASPAATYDLGGNTTVRMAANSTLNALMVTLEASSRMLQAAYQGQGFGLAQYAPMELNPTSIAFASPAGGSTTMYVLNSTASTIGVIPGNMTAFGADATLEDFRVKAMNAYLDLGAALLQNLKDCFCDLLLPPCASCDTESPEGLGVGLACITVKNGKVYKICNLEARQYVKTFKTWGYWLSLIPIIPLVKTLVSRFCCSILPELASKVSAPQSDDNLPYRGFATTNGETLRYAASKVGSLKTADMLAAFGQQATPVSKLTLDAVASPFKPSISVTGYQLDQANGLSLDQAKTNLAAANVNIAATEAYDPTAFTKNIAAYTTMPPTVPAGSSVTLVVDSNNQVRYIVPTPPVVDHLSSTVESIQVDVLKQVGEFTATDAQLQQRLTADEAAQAPAQQSIQSLQNLVTALQTNLTTLQTSQAAALATRDAQIATLTTQTHDLQTKLASLSDLAATVQQLQARLPEPPASQAKG